MTTLEAAPEVAADRAVAICQSFQLSPLARTLLDDDVTAPRYYRRLREMELYADARRVLAHALPPRRAVWWAAMCLRDSAGRKPLATGETAAFTAAVRWAVEPTDGHRRLAGKAGRAAGVTTAAGELALAAFFSGGSLIAPHLPVVPPKPFLTGRLCGVVVYRASVRAEPARYKEHLRQYLDIGERVARGELEPPAAESAGPLPAVSRN